MRCESQSAKDMRWSQVLPMADLLGKQNLELVYSLPVDCSSEEDVVLLHSNNPLKF